MSQFSTLLYLALVIAVPFLLAMILLYITLSFFKEEPVYCEQTRMVALLKKIHEDGSTDALELVCSGWVLISGATSKFMVSSDCFSNFVDGSLRKAQYFCSSGSLYWSQKRNLHSIKGIEDFGDITHVSVSPPFPECITRKNHTIRGDSEFPLALAGWKSNSRFSAEAYVVMRIETSPKCYDINGGVVIDNSGKIVFLQRKNCVAKREFAEISDNYRSFNFDSNFKGTFLDLT